MIKPPCWDKRVIKIGLYPQAADDKKPANRTFMINDDMINTWLINNE